MGGDDQKHNDINNQPSKFQDHPSHNQTPTFNISPPESDSDSEQPPSKDCHLLNPDSFELYRCRSEGSVLRTPKKGCLLKKNSDLRHKLPRHVSFADASGYALTKIHVFETRPKSFSDFSDLDSDDKDCLLLASRKVSAPAKCTFRNERRFVPYFSLPWSDPGKQSLILDILEERKICLESVSINSPWQVTGTILVKNLCFHKRVFVRQSLDKWQTFMDVQAEHVCVVNPDVDRFKFDLRFPFKMGAGTRLEMALGYEQGDTCAQHWDSNCGNNYAFWYNS